jgi:hypothetical protein
MNFSDDDLVMLFYLQKYNFLTINQAVRAIDNDRSYQVVGRRLRAMADTGYVGFFGGHKVGFANVPKVYYLTKKGFEFLLDNEMPLELLGSYKEKSNPSWSSQTKHRLFLVDVFLSLESGVRRNQHLDLVKVFLEYNRVKEGNRVVFETTDFVSDKETSENKIVPDGAFVLKSLRTNNRVLFFVEMDMGTEGVISRVSKDINVNLYERIKKYDKYLVSGNYVRKYKLLGNFDHFVLLFITLSEKRMENIRGKLFDLPDKFHQYYMFNTYDVVVNDFFNNQWRVRSVEDNNGYGLLG